LPQSTVPHAVVPLQSTVHCSLLHVMSPHASVPVQLIMHSWSAGQSTGLWPNVTVIVHVGGDTFSSQDVHCFGQMLSPTQ
jgi:hypothetical protein